MRAAVLTAASVALTSIVLANAWTQRQQFYPSVVYITKSNPSMAVIYLQSLVLVILMGKLMRKVFFGQLRAAEFEHLMERSWYAVTETCLAFTVFKDDFSPKFVALFTLLLFLKSFHWLAEDRVDYMERSPVITILFHLRVLSLALVLASLDMFFIQHAYTSTLTKGPSVQLVFGFEYAILLTIIINLIVKWVLHSIDLHSENPWENKAVFMLYTELFIGFIKVLLYILFFVIMVRIYTLPLFAVRPMYLTMRAFKKAFNDVVLSRRAIHNMNTLYPDATAEELANTDNVCIICREEMTVPSLTKKLPCGHIFHRNCLRSWFQRQQTCPTCRMDVLRASGSATAGAGQPAAAAAQQHGPQQHPQVGQQPAQMIFQQQMAALRNNLEALQRQRQQGQPPAGNTVPQPQAQEAAAPQNPGVPNFMNLMAGGVPPFPFNPPPQPQQQPQTGATTTTIGQSTAPTSNTASSTSPGATAGSPAGGPRPPFMFPPFPFMPFTVPPPQPPPNFSGMSEAELRAMEGTERTNVEARIRCLRNIQVLLDAAVMEMQQYSAVVARHNIVTPVPQTPVSSPPSTSTSGVASSTSASSTSDVASSSATSAVASSLSAVVSSTSGVASTSASGTASNFIEENKPVMRQKCDSTTTSTVVTSSTSSNKSISSSVTSSNISQTSNLSGLRPASETGARPKSSLIVPTSPSIPVQSETLTNGKNNNVNDLKEEDKTDNSDQEQIRQRRLAVFEEQKKRLMKKGT